MPAPLRPLAAPARALADALRTLVFPALCLGCDRRLPPERATDLPLCAACLRHLPRAPADAALARLARLPPEAPRPARAVALWTFDAGGTIRRLQHALKYGGRPALGVALGHLLGRVVAEGAGGYDLVVPVPLGRARLLTRGYNQAERIAEGVAGAVGHPPVCEGLVRARPTRSQTALSRARRWQNVGGAFAVAPGLDPAALDGARVLLVDDVLTTGATLAAAAVPLLAAGARVDVAVLACVTD